MKRNGMCPICYLRSKFGGGKIITKQELTPFDNQARKSPVMGWSSWNTFMNVISEDVIVGIADKLVETGLRDAGYIYVNIDDNWHSGERDENGDIVPDYTTFPNGMKHLADYLNSKGLKLGLYSSNGTLTCEDLPAALGNEEHDAYTFAKYGAEYLKYDFCHHIYVSKYAPLIYKIEIDKLGTGKPETYLCSNAKLEGFAKFMPCKKVDGGQYISGLDAGKGKATFKVTVPEDGKYVLTLGIRKYGSKYTKMCMAKINGKDEYVINVPEQKKMNVVARFQKIVELKSGENTIELFNPIANKRDSERMQYRKMGDALMKASKRLAEETGNPEKKMILGICEWGWGKPYLWGASAGNMWRTTPDIKCFWPWMMLIYRHNVKLHEYASEGHFNDPDSLEVGNGKLTFDENQALFAIWCMMASPLILGNDLRKMNDQVLGIVSNKDLIAIDQDELFKQGKLVKKGAVDVIAKPIVDGTAVCFFNHRGGKKTFTYDLDNLVNDNYVAAKKIEDCEIKELVNHVEIKGTTAKAALNKHSVCVFILKNK